MVRLNRLISSTPGKALLWGYGLGVAGFYAALFRRTGLVGTSSDATPADGGGAGTAGTEWPCVSIIVPARDEERNIRYCVASLLAQRYPSFEVIVVDDATITSKLG